MSYPNFLGEFVAPIEKDDWVNYVKWNERKPVLIHGALNPWELERTRAVWQAEQAAWSKIVVLKKEYQTRERAIKTDIGIAESHITELKRITKSKAGSSAALDYATMAVTALVGIAYGGPYGAMIAGAKMGIDILLGSKVKKRIKELIRIIEEANERIIKNKQRLINIQYEVRDLMGVTERSKQAGSAKMQADIAQSQHSQEAYRLQKQTQDILIDQELNRARQLAPSRVRYVNDL